MSLMRHRATQPTVVMSIPLVWGVRNVIRSGLADRLRTRFRVVFAIPAEGRSDIVNEGVPESDIWVLEKSGDTRLPSWMRRILRRAHRWKHPTATDALVDEWNEGSRNTRGAIRDLVFDALGRFAKRDAIFRWLEQQEQERCTRSIPAGVWQFLSATKPVFGLSTTCVVSNERPLFHAMRALRIPTATHVLSFDNVTSHGYVPLFKSFDRYFVWQERMADELMRFYQVPPDRITITGTPQFDFHVDPALCWSRAKTTAALGLDPRKRYIVYAANHFAVTPSEPELIGPMIRELSSGSVLRDHQWVVRLHPMDRYARWEGVARELPQVKLSRPWLHDDQASFWGAPSRDDLALLGNTLRHADVAVTIASSVVLDCAVVDTPAVCVGFHPDPTCVDGRRNGPVHWQHHFRPIMESEAAPLAMDLAGLRQDLEEAVNNRAARRDQRAGLVRGLCGVVDGRASERIADALMALVSRPVRADRAEAARV